MAEASFASLNTTLLARKGGAKPAMRPQHAALASMSAPPNDGDHETLEDLGWNDMGSAPGAQTSAEVYQLNPIARPAEPAMVPTAPHERESVAERIAPSAKSNVQTSRSAFTLRLDADRHLRLRLACAVRGTSAQLLVTEALDAMLGEMPELETLAAQVRRH